MVVTVGVKSTGGEVIGAGERKQASTGKRRRRRVVKVEVGIKRRNPKFISSALLEDMVRLVSIGHGRG